MSEIVHDELQAAPETLRLAIVQCDLSGDEPSNLAAVERGIRQAAAAGAKLILPPELFASRYFPQKELDTCFALAETADTSRIVQHGRALAAELRVVLPVSFFERDGMHFYNSVAMIDADGSVLGVYRKSHIPDGPGYEEKYYFRPGNTGFRVWQTQVGCIGVGICWDQWFPECARAMALLGADVLLYPTAIGSEPEEPGLDTSAPWQRVMVGHAVANATFVAAANRVGREDGIDFYGSSFIADQRGDLVATLPRDGEGVACADVDLAALRRYRASFGFFRDRRPELYSSLCRV